MTIGPRSADPTPTPDGSGAPKVVAEGVPSALRSDPGWDDGRRPVAWLHINAPGRGVAPSARSWCACERDMFAAGQRRVLALIADHEQHRTDCQLIPTPKEGRKAA
ncbi:hypothetical protein GCM10010215_77120 [Streptomyces virginiae]|uniref:Uncharacterized protein n=1 Tax=Streptomyces virginiae TaxID=1961 RepID=A0ABQ3NUP2_STRVG|nr:hypothetical protein [Streptomyces virginiae]MBP2345146.1 hypothetical protein [Streptomyces virginiae]GGQ42141.1 hypothetical protein GCM10010215_77120 [Streptomyces virginiae]GHI16490.1 hypothetical protein Scinn_59530 [Streptomyces virginiae]